MTAVAVRPGASARAESIVRGDHFRITVLTSRLLRLEWSPTGTFVDAPTPMVLTRDFPTPEYRVTESAGRIELRTDHLALSYDKRAFSPSGLTISLRQRSQSGLFTSWRYGDHLDGSAPSANLGGTARTLDGADGAIDLDPGVLSRHGFAVLDDSGSVEIGADGQVGARPEGGEDLYFFGHGLDFQAALTEFHRLSGPTPLVPRQILGNWWSRYWRYSERSYLDLMDRFRADRVPFAVAVVDMDWHLVDIDPALGSGWTGYTWNRELFPDPERFLDALHERGMLVTLNLHPADGVRAHEEAYPAMARALGVDPASRVEIPFDITSPRFVDAYLTHLHHPLEEQGVDFWWIDWQSGATTAIPGLDPLWMLNDIHFRDSGRDGRRPLTFSRYAGVGSHRQPIGFSGDTIATWDSLAFQPYFTATAANVGYTWWSHDVGGHIGGRRDDELATRWVQLGVFSPINRLHSSADPFMSKDPACFPPEPKAVMERFLRLRHRLVPHLYTAAWRAHEDGVGVVRPMYHEHPREDAAYSVPNQYYFGSDVIVAPITAPGDPESRLAHTEVWLPEGDWVDLFTGQRYHGGRRLAMHRPLDQIPVLVRAGATLALLEDPLEELTDVPDTLVLRIAPGSGRSVVLEDDGAAAPARSDRFETWVEVVHEEITGELTITVGSAGAAPGRSERELVLDLVGVAGVASVQVAGIERPDLVAVGVEDELLAPALRLRLGRVDLSEPCEIAVTGVVPTTIDPAARAFALLDRAQIAYDVKQQALRAVEGRTGLAMVEELGTVALPQVLRGALVEAVAAS